MEAGVIVLLALLLVEIWGLKYQTHPNDLLSYQCTNILRGVCCFPVVFCHMNEPYNLMVLVTKWVDKHTIPYTINNLSVLTP